ncbi:hypothetical protein GF360_01720 [candidate division WWE3 bacterium]|nr:hypothetical protein [candidate division WWE3 bacterium]
MQFLTSILYVYLGLGFIYGLYVTFAGNGKWYTFPINVLGGPIVVVIILYKSLTGRKFHV